MLIKQATGEKEYFVSALPDSESGSTGLGGGGGGGGGGERGEEPVSHS